MLKNLAIRNVALVERADISFSEGLNVLSGETGAGKSVILDSIDFVLGAKADKSMIRSGESECSVRAEFSVDEDGEIDAILDELDVEREDSIVISRRLSADGKGGAKVNGCSVTLSMLKKLTAKLVDIHGQSEHFFLLKESNQLRLLDRVAGEDAAVCKAAVAERLAQRKEILSRLSLLGGDESERSRRLDILRFQIDEIERADLKEKEEEELVALRDKYSHAEKILGCLNAAREFLLSDGGAADAANGALHAVLPLNRFAEYADFNERLENAASEIADIGNEAERLAEELDIDEGERERVETRLDELKTVKKKYGGSVQAALSFLSRAREEAELLEDSEEQFGRLQAELKNAERELYAACLALTEARKRAAVGFEKRVIEELKTLNIASARFSVQFDEYSESDVGSATSEGLGGVRFLFSANAGEPPKELGKIISGGEMSRFMLAVKAQLNSVNGIGTYLFDEIDAGIGGKTAKTVAEKFAKISRTTQIIAVSHLAQIAASADRQFLIEKVERNGKTHTQVGELSGEARRAELARLIAGDATELALKHADELLAAAEKYKNSI